MNRATGTTMKPITLVSAFRHYSGNTTPCTSSWPFCAVLNLDAYGRMDFRVWHNNYGILATNINPVTAPHSGTVTDQLQCTANYSITVSCSQRLLT